MNTKRSTSSIDYEHGKIPSLFRKVFFPTLLGMIFNAMITIIDGIFVGQGVGPEGIAAVNIIAPLFMVTTGIGLMFGIGASVSAGIALASKDNTRANSITTSAFLFSTCIVLLLVLSGAMFPYHMAEILGSSDILYGESHRLPLVSSYRSDTTYVAKHRHDGNQA